MKVKAISPYLFFIWKHVLLLSHRKCSFLKYRCNTMLFYKYWKSISYLGQNLPINLNKIVIVFNFKKQILFQVFYSLSLIFIDNFARYIKLQDTGRIQVDGKLPVIQYYKSKENPSCSKIIFFLLVTAKQTIHVLYCELDKDYGKNIL